MLGIVGCCNFLEPICHPSPSLCHPRQPSELILQILPWTKPPESQILVRTWGSSCYLVDHVDLVDGIWWLWWNTHNNHNTPYWTTGYCIKDI
jgi:hypothetical protein